MLAVSKSRPRNRLLAALSTVDIRLLQAHLAPVPLSLRQELELPDRQINTVYFPESGVASVVAVQSKETRVEVGLIGCEGMSGTSVVLGNDRSPHSTYIQVAGEGHRISADKLRDVLRASPSIHGLFLRYVQVFMVQTAHTAIANARGRVDARLARWILMAHDRATDNRLSLTHEFMALMLGVRRAGVTEALHSLETQNVIAAGRGEILVLDRKGIERVAGKLYGTPEAEFRRLIG